jgi:hypothetical protein
VNDDEGRDLVGAYVNVAAMLGDIAGWKAAAAQGSPSTTSWPASRTSAPGSLPRALSLSDTYSPSALYRSALSTFI